MSEATFHYKSTGHGRWNVYTGSAALTQLGEVHAVGGAHPGWVPYLLDGRRILGLYATRDEAAEMLNKATLPETTKEPTMTQTVARTRAKEIAAETGRTAIADSYRITGTGRALRGGWPSPDDQWAVFDAETGEPIEGVEGIEVVEEANKDA